MDRCKTCFFWCWPRWGQFALLCNHGFRPVFTHADATPTVGWHGEVPLCGTFVCNDHIGNVVSIWHIDFQWPWSSLSWYLIPPWHRILKPCLMSGEACAVRFWHWNFHGRARLIHYRNLEVSTKQRWLNMNYYLYMIFSHSHFHCGDFTANHVWSEGQQKMVVSSVSTVQGSRESVSKARSLIQWCKWGCRNTSANGPIFFSVINLKPSCCQVNILISVDPYPHGHMQKMIFHRMLTCKKLGYQFKLQNGTVIATCNIVSETCKHGSLTIV